MELRESENADCEDEFEGLLSEKMNELKLKEFSNSTLSSSFSYTRETSIASISSRRGSGDLTASRTLASSKS